MITGNLNVIPDARLKVLNIHFLLILISLNKANTSNTKAAFLDLHLSISNNIVSTKIYDKCDDFDFEIVNFHF